MTEQKRKLAIPVPTSDDETTPPANPSTVSVDSRGQAFVPEPTSGAAAAPPHTDESAADFTPSATSATGTHLADSVHSAPTRQSVAPEGKPPASPASSASPQEVARSEPTRPPVEPTKPPVGDKIRPTPQQSQDDAGKIVEKLVGVGLGVLESVLKRKKEQSAARTRMAALLQAQETQRAQLAREQEERRQKAAMDAATKAMAEAAAHARRVTDDLQRRNATAQIQRGWLEHGVVVGGVRGINIHLAFTITGMQGTEGMVAAFLQYADGAPVRNKNDKFGTKDGQVAVWTSITPRFPTAHYADLSLFMPNDEFHLSVRRVNLRWLVRVLTAPTGRALAELWLPCVWSEG